MIGKKINQLATELAPASTDLTIIGNPTTGVSKKITLAQLGAIFSGAVSFYTNYAAFPTPGTTDVIYCAKDTKKLYLWSGSAYVEVFPSQALLDTYQLRSEKGNANGYASLDSSGKVPVSQLPSSIMEYKGTWSAATNTPTLANGTGDTGDVYICNAAGSVNFGAGAITFAVGDYVIYSGSIWQRSSGAVGTVTSVAASITGNAIGITGSPVTTSGTLALAFAGTSAQYVNGAGNLITFPSIISQAQNIVSEVYNNTGATLTKGTIVYINGGQGNLPTVTKALATGDSTSAQTYGIVQADITNMNNGYVVVAGRLTDLDTQAYSNGTQLYLSGTTAGTWTSTKPYAPIHLVYVGIVVRSHPTQGVVEVKIQNGYELDEIHNVSAQTPTNNDGLFWEASTSLWKNKSISTILGGTPITGSGNVNAIPKFTANSVLGNSVMEDDGNFVSMRGLKLNVVAGSGSSINFGQASSISAAGLGYSSIGASGTAGFIFYIDQNTTQRSFIIDVNNINSATTRNYSMPNASGTFALTSDIPSLTGYVPYTGATNNVNLGTYDLYARSLYVEGTASYQSGLVIKQISGFNYVTGAYTQLAPSGIYDLNVVHNQTNGTRRIYQLSVASLQDGDNFQYLVPRKNGTFAMTSDIPSLTGYVSGTGTTNYLPKFTGTSTIGNSQIFDNGTNVGVGTASPSTKLEVYSSDLNNIFVTNPDTTGAATGSGIGFKAYNGTSVTQSAGIFLTANSWTYGTYAKNQLAIASDGTGGLGFKTANSAPIIFYTGGSTAGFSNERMRLNNTGQLSIGTTSGSSSADVRLILNSTTGSFIGFGNNGNAGGAVGSPTNSTLTFYTSTGTLGSESYTERARIDASGNLGLGVSNPTFAGGSGMHINASGNDVRLHLTNSTSGALSTDGYEFAYVLSDMYYDNKENGSHIWYANGGERMRLNASGNLGIGSSTIFNGGGFGKVISLYDATAPAISLVNASKQWQLGVSGTNFTMYDATNFTNVFVLNGSTGAATFSSSVTAGGKGIFETNTTVGYDGTYTGYASIGLGGTTNGYNRVFGGVGTADGLFLASATGRGIYFRAGGGTTDQVTISSTGNVAIGTTDTTNGILNLNGVLDINKDSTTVGARWRRGATTVGYIGTGDWAVNGLGTSDFGISSGSTGALVFGTVAGSERMRITSGGNVGIGTTSPSAKLTVSGTQVETHINNGDTNTLTLGGYSGGRHFIKSINLGVALTPLTLQASSFTFDTGNVGIGTTSPSTKLEVNGAIKTGNPGLGSAGAIKLGQRFTGTAIGVGGYIPIDIDGTTYYINLATTTP